MKILNTILAGILIYTAVLEYDLAISLYSQYMQYGTGVYLDGVDDVIIIDNESAFDFAWNQPTTIDFWADIPPSMTYWCAFSKDAPNVYWKITFGDYGIGPMMYFSTVGYILMIYANPNYAQAGWHHYQFINFGNTTGAIYIDGISIPVTNYLSAPAVSNLNDAPAKIGLEPYFGQPFQGIIGFFRLWRLAVTRPLNNDFTPSYYVNGINQVVVCYNQYSFSNIPTVLDVSGNGNHGTATGAFATRGIKNR